MNFHDDPAEAMKRMSRRSFIWAGGAVAGTAAFYAFMNKLAWAGGRWGQPGLMRRSFEMNEALWEQLASNERHARTFPTSDISSDAKVNGTVGLMEVDPEDWRLHIEGAVIPIILSLDEIRAMPSTEMTTELNCIEGWTRVINWKGVRFSDMVAALGIDMSSLPKYVGLETPTRGYYVGHHLQSCLHAQSLLAYDMNGSPLTPPHGAPLRHVLPTKYGYKQLKHIGKIIFTKTQPADYWAEQGYDWYGGF